MIHWRIWVIGAGVASAGLAASAKVRGAVAPHLPAALTHTASPASAPGIDQDAMQALDDMGKYLRTLNVIQVHADVTTEDVMEDGQKVTTMKSINLVAQRPNKLWAEVADERAPRFFFYDGKTFTLWAPRTRYYAKAGAPPTINQLADTLDEKFNIDLPLVDLFRWGTPDSDLKGITAAEDLGSADVDGTTCEHYAYRQEGLDWQVWIQQGDFALPRKLVLTTTTDEARPQHSSTWTWNLAPSYDDSTFVFTPPKDAHQIQFRQVAAMRDSVKKAGGGK